MKPEKQIAEKNIKKRDMQSEGSNLWLSLNGRCNEHNDSCQRFLEFLGEYSKGINTYLVDLNGKFGGLIVSRRINLNKEAEFYDKIKINMDNKITDLQNAIKLYEDAGI